MFRWLKRWFLRRKWRAADRKWAECYRALLREDLDPVDRVLWKIAEDHWYQVLARLDDELEALCSPTP